MAMLTPTEIARLNLWAMLPDTVSKLTELMGAAEKELGLRTYVRKFGGYRGPNVQEQLVAWRNQADAKDGIIGAGRDWYAVAPAGKSHHEWGAAFDLHILEPSKRTDANYRAIAAISRRIGLRPGYYFSRRDEFHHELAITLDDAQRR
jgi:LAS superfamily LD-carboxypeptidase LdcB